MHILFVDDVAETRASFAWAFGNEGHTAQLASDGTEALVEKERFDAIVMDVEMGRMDGIETTRRMRQLPHGQQVPILVLTGYTENEYREAALEAGANGVIYKPILPKVVLSRLKELQRIALLLEEVKGEDGKGGE